jgi:hypothetical protein
MTGMAKTFATWCHIFIKSLLPRSTLTSCRNILVSAELNEVGLSAVACVSGFKFLITCLLFWSDTSPLRDSLFHLTSCM